jgi:hypothetical protein
VNTLTPAAGVAAAQATLPDDDFHQIMKPVIAAPLLTPATIETAGHEGVSGNRGPFCLLRMA